MRTSSPKSKGKESPGQAANAAELSVIESPAHCLAGVTVTGWTLKSGGGESSTALHPPRRGRKSRALKPARSIEIRIFDRDRGLRGGLGGLRWKSQSTYRWNSQYTR